MKKLMIGLLVIAFAGIAIADIQTAFTQRDVRDPRRLEGILENNFGDARTRIIALEDANAGGTLASTNVIIGSAGNVATARAISGDATLGNTGVLTVPKVARITLRDAENPDRVVLREEGAGTNFVTVKSVDTLTGDRTVLIPDADVNLGEIRDEYATVAVVAADTTAGTGTVTITVVDADGDPVDFYFEGWVSDAASGAVVSQTADLSVSTGIELQEIAAGDHYRGISASGSVVLTLTGDDTGHVVLVILGKVYTTPFTVTTGD